MVRISTLAVYHVRFPLKTPWKTAYGSEKWIDTVLIQAATDKGEKAWVESCPLRSPLYTPETAGTVCHIIKHFFAPAILDQELYSAGTIPSLLSCYRGNPFAKAALEACWWALVSTIDNVPLHRLFGGEARPIRTTWSSGIPDSMEQLLGSIEEAKQKGYQRIKLKIKREMDESIIEEVKRCFPDILLHIDGNGGYTLDDIPLFKRWDKFGNIAILEQPFHDRDFYGHALLQKQVSLQICLDESITSIRDAEQAFQLGSCKSISIKPGRVGGFSEAIAIANICKEYGGEWWVGGMMETGIGAACNLELATLADQNQLHEITTYGKFHHYDLIYPRIIPDEQGFIMPSSSSYIGKKIILSPIPSVAVYHLEPVQSLSSA